MFPTIMMKMKNRVAMTSFEVDPAPYARTHVYIVQFQSSPMIKMKTVVRAQPTLFQLSRGNVYQSPLL